MFNIQKLNDSLSSYTLPLGLVLGLFGFSAIGPYWTFGSFLAFPITLQIVRKNLVYEKNIDPNTDSAVAPGPGPSSTPANAAVNQPAVPRRGMRRRYVQGMTKFYYNLTRISFIVSLGISESLCANSSLDLWRRFTLALTLGSILIVKKKSLSSSSAPITSQSGGFPGGFPGSNGRDYCGVCGVLIPGRDHHCSWLDCCIGQRNWMAFIAALILSSFHASILMYSCFTTVCEGQVSIHNIWTTSGSTLQCPLMYIEYSSTLVWILCLYGLVITALLLAILYHQLFTNRRKMQNSNKLR